MLEVSNLTKRFGNLAAVDQVDLEINEGEVVGLIGPNGAGKTTLFNLLMGVHKPTQGRISINGRDLTGLGTAEIARAGIGRTFQIVRTFNEMTVRENVMRGIVFGRGDHTSPSQAHTEAIKYLEFVGLEDKADVETSNLTIAERRQVEIARALGMKPHLLLLDETASGLNPAEVSALSETIGQIKDEYGTSVFWIEHIMDAIMGTADRIIVLNQGKEIAEGTPSEIRQNEAVSEVYLGGAV